LKCVTFIATACASALELYVDFFSIPLPLATPNPFILVPCAPPQQEHRKNIAGQSWGESDCWLAAIIALLSPTNQPTNRHAWHGKPSQDDRANCRARVIVIPPCMTHPCMTPTKAVP